MAPRVCFLAAKVKDDETAVVIAVVRGSDDDQADSADRGRRRGRSAWTEIIIVVRLRNFSVAVAGADWFWVVCVVICAWCFRF